MDKKYQIFISSTYKDLIHEREKVRDVILSMYQFPIGMEMFSAADEDQWLIIKDTIDSSDYYVLIIGKRYGSVIEDGPDKGLSYTEKEYRYAKSIGLPILAYIKEEKSITADNVDDEPEKITKLRNFVMDVKKGREVKWFSSIDQLATEVSLSLHKEMDKKKRPGWIRNDSVDIEKSLYEIVELSKQNRKLQEENSKLQKELEKLKSASDHKPKLKISIIATKYDENDDNSELYHHDDIINIDQNGVVYLKLKKISLEAQKEKYRELSIEDIPSNLINSVFIEDIKKYNESLPSQAEIDKYIKEYKLFRRIKENGVAVTVLINNVGTAKATDVTVTIDFPNQIQVIDIDKVSDINEIPGPKLPDNPIVIAEKRMEKKNTIALNLSYVDKLLGVNSDIDYSSIKDKITTLSIRDTIFQSIEIEDNTVNIEDKQGIVHTKFNYFDGAYIVPLISGVFEANVTLMCAEYEMPEKTTIKFIVTE